MTNKKTISHFQILEPLGSGGMGQVYKALDTKLKRTVALKFVSSDLLNKPEARSRLLREARSAATLNHNNICTIHEVGEVQPGEDVRLETGELLPPGTPFIAMELIEGKPLDTVLLKSGPLPLDEFLDMAVQIAEGLAEAHAQGIVHRDLKPQNVVVTPKGLVKILDFGLAKPLSTDDEMTSAAETITAPLTHAGMLLGTAPYMSPEQAKGKEVDSRSDVFSFGVMLYELTTGKRPFHGENAQEILAKILEAEPTPLCEVKQDLPVELERIARRCLRKKPEERYNDTRDLVAALKDLKEPTSTEGVQQAPKPETPKPKNNLIKYALPTSVVLLAAILFIILKPFQSEITPDQRTGPVKLAVIPFENLGASEDEYFADGITEEITARLAGIHGLGVIARTSAIQYKNTDKNIQQIGEELGVEYIIKGTIRWQRAAKDPSRVRVTPQLIRVSDATHLWADVYDEVLTEVFEIQSDIAKKVVSALNVTLLEPERELLESKPTDNLEAYGYYLRGNEYFKPGTSVEKPYRLASQLYEKAVELDSNFASAYARLSRVYTELYWHYDRRGEDLARARQAADKAIELSPGLPDVHVAQGSYYYHQKDYDRALEEFNLAREEQPNNADLLEEIGFVRRRQGLFELAIADLKRALELDPRSATKATNLGDTYNQMREYGKAEAYYDRAISLAPDEAEHYANKAQLYVVRDANTEAARRLLQKASEVVEPTPWFNHTWAWVDVCSGDYEAALTKLTADFPFNSPGAHYYKRAAIYGLLGRPEMERAYYDSARVFLEERVAAVPDDALYLSGLGIAYAGLGLKNDAIREGELAAKLAPISQDTFSNTDIVISLAQIYVMVGEYEDAIDQLEVLLSVPARISIPSLRVDPTWDLLRDHPQFQALLEKYGDVGS